MLLKCKGPCKMGIQGKNKSENLKKGITSLENVFFFFNLNLTDSRFSVLKLRQATYALHFFPVTHV